MTEIKTNTPLSQVLPDGNTVNKTRIEIILNEELPVYCENKITKKNRLMPFKVLYENNQKFWQQRGNWEYFFTKDTIIKLNERLDDLAAPRKNLNMEHIEGLEELEELDEAEGFGREYESFSSMSINQKTNYLLNSKQLLTDLTAQKHHDADVITKALVDTTKDAALINHAVLQDAIRLGDDEAKKITQSIIESTHEMVKSSTRLISEDIFDNDLMATLVQKSNGTIVQHMTRVYLTGISFLAYYNKLVSSSSAIQKIRIAFPVKYRKFYHSLLPHLNIDDILLENIFYGGMRAIPPEYLTNWAVGFLIHDIGKAAAVQYHEGEAKYDRSTVIDHVKLGYKSVMAKTNYPMEACLIIGYHHEYYGNSDGYGYFRAYLQQYKKLNPGAKQNYCIAYEKEPMLDHMALAYFPAKVLEIIDVYDSLTDHNRIYRKAVTPEEALAMMREDFIVKHHKIDFILFDIFENFINAQEARKTKTITKVS